MPRSVGVMRGFGHFGKSGKPSVLADGVIGADKYTADAASAADAAVALCRASA